MEIKFVKVPEIQVSLHANEIYKTWYVNEYPSQKNVNSVGTTTKN